MRAAGTEAVIPALCALTICTGEVSAGAAVAFGTGPGDHGSAVMVHWRGHTGLAPYIDVLAAPKVQTVAIGLTYRVARGRWYFDPGLGVAVHLGDGRSDFGSTGLFHLIGDVGYRLTDRVALEFVAEHWSNAFLARPNHGLNAVGFRLAVRY